MDFFRPIHFLAPVVKLAAAGKLEELAAPHLPLRLCQGKQGAYLLVGKYWMRRGKKRAHSEGNLILVSDIFC